LKKYILILLLFTTGRAFAQDETKPDFNTWSSMGLGYKFNKKMSFELQEQLRLKENSGTIDQYFTHLSGKYELFKNFDLGLGLRFIKTNDNKGKVQGYENFIRYQMDAAYGYKIERISISHRIRYQNKSELKTDEKNQVQQIRFKTGLSYNIPHWKLDPEVSGEIFSLIKNLENNSFKKYRITLETNYSLRKMGKIKLFYRLERPSEPLGDKTNVLGLGYSYTIKN
jgi:hypothetical protein